MWQRLAPGTQVRQRQCRPEGQVPNSPRGSPRWAPCSAAQPRLPDFEWTTEGRGWGAASQASGSKSRSWTLCCCPLSPSTAPSPAAPRAGAQRACDGPRTAPTGRQSEGAAPRAQAGPGGRHTRCQEEMAPSLRPWTEPPSQSTAMSWGRPVDKQGHCLI